MARVTVKWKPLRPKRLVSDAALQAAGRELARKVVRRTQSGYDERGRRFRPYAASYARWKGVARTAVDLTLTGEMLDDFDVIAASRGRVRLGFTRAAMQRRAASNEARGRRFLGLESRWTKDVRRRLARAISFTSGA